MACPGKDLRGVAIQHTEMGYDYESGQLCIAALDDDYPVTVFSNLKPKELRKGDRYMVVEPMTLFGLGKLLLVFEVSALNIEQRIKYVKIRDMVFKELGVPVPDKRLPSLPWEVKRHQPDSTTLGEFLGRGTWGVVWSGSNISTGRSCAVKEILVWHTKVLEEL